MSNDTNYIEADRSETERLFAAWLASRSAEDKAALCLHAEAQIRAKLRASCGPLLERGGADKLDYLTEQASIKLLDADWKAERVEEWGALLMSVVRSVRADAYRHPALLDEVIGEEYDEHIAPWRPRTASTGASANDSDDDGEPSIGEGAARRIPHSHGEPEVPPFLTEEERLAFVTEAAEWLSLPEPDVAPIDWGMLGRYATRPAGVAELRRMMEDEPEPGPEASAAVLRTLHATERAYRGEIVTGLGRNLGASLEDADDLSSDERDEIERLQQQTRERRAQGRQCEAPDCENVVVGRADKKTCSDACARYLVRWRRDSSIPPRRTKTTPAPPPGKPFGYYALNQDPDIPEALADIEWIAMRAAANGGAPGAYVPEPTGRTPGAPGSSPPSRVPLDVARALERDLAALQADILRLRRMALIAYARRAEGKRRAREDAP